MLAFDCVGSISVRTLVRDRQPTNPSMLVKEPLATRVRDRQPIKPSMLVKESLATEPREIVYVLYSTVREISANGVKRKA